MTGQQRQERKRLLREVREILFITGNGKMKNLLPAQRKFVLALKKADYYLYTLRCKVVGRKYFSYLNWQRRWYGVQKKMFLHWDTPHRAAKFFGEEFQWKYRNNKGRFCPVPEGVFLRGRVAEVPKLQEVPWVLPLGSNSGRGIRRGVDVPLSDVQTYLRNQ
jgi:hypothetical protein